MHAVKAVETMKQLAEKTLQSLIRLLGLKAGKLMTLREFRLKLNPEQVQPFKVGDGAERHRKRRQSWFEQTALGSDVTACVGLDI